MYRLTEPGKKRQVGSFYRYTLIPQVSEMAKKILTTFIESFFYSMFIQDTCTFIFLVKTIIPNRIILPFGSLCELKIISVALPFVLVQQRSCLLTWSKNPGGGGAHSTAVVSIICPLVEIGLTV